MLDHSWICAGDRYPELKDPDHVLALDEEGTEIAVVDVVDAARPSVPAFRIPTNGRTQARDEAGRETARTLLANQDVLRDCGLRRMSPRRTASNR
jgi:hypothetical protein